MNMQILPGQEPQKTDTTSMLIKLSLIFVLTILLLMPSSWIQDIILERQGRQEEVIAEVSDKWSTAQQLSGPVLILPQRINVSQRDSAGKLIYKESVRNIYILPEDLDVTGNVSPQVLHRGIFDVAVYDTQIGVKGKFSELELVKSGVDPASVLWNKAKVVIGLSDLKGLKNNPTLILDGKSYEIEPDFDSSTGFKNSLAIVPDLSAKKSSAVSFSFNLDLRGSNELVFLHTGKNSKVTIKGNWGNPSFTGRYLPEQRDISAEKFSATWKMPHFNRPYPQQWTGDGVILNVKSELASFGVKFILPVDQYQKTMRSAKYAILIIALTFISLFLTELMNKTRVHVLQYVLIGAAMIIYYTLLLSFSEQVGFDLAYLIASVATITLIGGFIASLLKSMRMAILFSGILVVFYGFIYVIIQLQDLALLFGSIGLFIIVAALMQISRKINWEKGYSLT